MGTLKEKTIVISQALKVIHLPTIWYTRFCVFYPTFWCVSVQNISKKEYQMNNIKENNNKTK